MHVGQHNLCPRPIIYNHAQQSGCGCGSALPEGPRHLLVGYGNVAVNRQQHSYNYPEGGEDWSVSGIVHLFIWGGGKEEGSGDSEQDAVLQWNVIIKLILQIT